MKKIITSHVSPPGPARYSNSLQWVAFYDGQEEGGLQGWGATEAEAIEDLKIKNEE